MPNYSYQAIDNSGKLFRGNVIALNDGEVELRLQQNGLTLIKSKQIKETALSKFFEGSRVQPRILIEFYYRLAQTLELGLPILSALEENAKLLPSKLLRRVAGETRVALEGGNTLYEAMSRYPKLFNRLDLGLIRMGEQSGMLPKVLKELAEFLEWKENIRSIIKRATIYPTFVMLAIVAVIGVWVGYVLPRMAAILGEMGIVLPPTTQVVLSVSLFLQSNWFWLLGAIIFSIISVYAIQRTKRGGILLHKYILKAPLIGEVALNIAVARLSHNFATMYRAGISINSIFEILADNVIGNRYLESRLTLAFEEIQHGQTIANSFENAGGFPPLLLGAIRNGETTGTLDDSFKRLGDYYDKEVKRAVEAMIAAFEPITMVILGGVFGLIALSIMLPLYDVISEFGKSY
jgi:type IV pilus assembly protein PilC